jgi:hypothetical protein
MATIVLEHWSSSRRKNGVSGSRKSHSLTMIGVLDAYSIFASYASENGGATLTFGD